MIVLLLVVAVAGATHGGPTTEGHKDQFCTDPRTMKKHNAYTEWADAYSCTRHRCQPGGRNLAIYTVGCKRVEAPESAIECEEVVEDTNMQFPYCCTRLRCLVVVRGEVWTRVLGQPWETLPAAPWSHMYKMKKPPPGENAFLPKTPGEGPIYELASDGENNDKVLRSSGKKPSAIDPDCIEASPAPRAAAVPAPDIVIALSTSNDAKDQQNKKVENININSINKKTGKERHKRNRKQQSNPYFDDDIPEHRNEIDVEEQPAETEKPPEAASEEKYFVNAFGVTQKPFKVNKKVLQQQLLQHRQVAWTEIPPSQWNDNETPMAEADVTNRDGNHSPDFAPPAPEEKKEEKPNNLQALVDAIGTRMRDIENVVQRMSEKVQQAKPGQPDYVSASNEKRNPPSDTEAAVPVPTPRKHHKADKEPKEPKEPKDLGNKRPSAEGEHYKRFSVRNRGSKYLHTTEATSEPPMFVEDTSLNGYFSDASNSVIRRSNPPKEPAASTYMAPVETRRKASHILVSEASDEAQIKHKKHTHKKKKNKGRSKKKHHKEEKKKRVNKVSSVELERNAVSLEDSSAIASK